MQNSLPLPKNVPSHDKDLFLRSMLRELTGILEKTVGEREAEAYVNYVGLSLGKVLSETYQSAFETDRLDPRQVAAALVDLKARMDGGFSIVSMDDEKIILENVSCPFGPQVKGRTSLCRMTANVFGRVTAENLGYARVRIDKAIARGDPKCRVEVKLKETKIAPGPDETEFFETDG